MPSVQCSSMFCCIGTGNLPEKSGNRSKFCWNGCIFVAIFPFLDRRKPIAILFYCNMNCGKNQVFSLKHSGCGKRFPQIHVEMSNPLCEMHKNAGESAVFFDLQSAEFPGTSPALCICSFPLRGLYRTYVRCPACAPESVRVYFGTCPVSCICTGTVRLLLVFSFVCPGFCLCNCAVATASRLAGAVREKGDGLCGALLLSLRHLSTSFQGIPLRRG